MDFLTVLTPILTIFGMITWDVLRTFYFAKYTVNSVRKELNRNSNHKVKLLTTKTHSNHYIN